MSPQVLAGEATKRTELAYTFRVYNVRCPVMPKACRLDIYDPDFTIVQTVAIAQTDFKPVVGQSSTFEVNKIIPFQPQKAGDYHFVVEAQQSDDPRELNDAGKWALERNGQGTAPSYFVSTTRSPGINEAGVPMVFNSGPAGAQVAAVLEKIGYSANQPATPPWWLPTTTGVRNNVDVDTAVGYETGGGLNGQNADSRSQTMEYNAVWTCIGHGTISRMPDGTIPRAIGRRMQFNSGDATAPENSYVTTNDWVKAAYHEADKGKYVAMMNMPFAKGGPTGSDTKKPFNAVRLMAFFGCNTSYRYENRTDSNLETLTEVAHRQGARSAIGLRGELKVWQINKFATSFYYYLGQGKTASAAMLAAVDDAQMHGLDTMGVFNMGSDIAGDAAVRLDGPKWGREQ